MKAWLEQADDVKSNGGPTHYSLIKALRKIEQNTVADGIDKESKTKIVSYTEYFLYLVEHPSCVIFARYKSDQSIHELLPNVTLFLHKEGIIAMMIPATAQALISAVEDSVCVDQHNLKKFAAILQKFTTTVPVGDAIIENYSKFL